jgi:hypothetical protein
MNKDVPNRIQRYLASHDLFCEGSPFLCVVVYHIYIFFGLPTKQARTRAIVRVIKTPPGLGSSPHFTGSQSHACQCVHMVTDPKTFSPFQLSLSVLHPPLLLRPSVAPLSAAQAPTCPQRRRETGAQGA